MVLPGVFHPGFFHSTKFVIEFLEMQSLQGKSFLELGCGTGLISVIASRAGAIVTSSDLNPKAIENTKQNAIRNSVSLSTIQSDLFDSIPPQKFDWIIINPPYYPRAAKDDAELAWNCGENFDYFQKLFSSLHNFLHQTTQVIMVITLRTALDKILAIGHEHGYEFEPIAEQKRLFDEKDFLFRIRSKKISSFVSDQA